MLDLTPFKFAASLALGGCVIYAALWLMLQAWRLFVAWCMEIAE